MMHDISNLAITVILSATAFIVLGIFIFLISTTLYLMLQAVFGNKAKVDEPVPGLVAKKSKKEKSTSPVEDRVEPSLIEPFVATAAVATVASSKADAPVVAKSDSVDAKANEGESSFADRMADQFAAQAA